MRLRTLHGNIVLLIAFLSVPGFSYSQDFKELWKEKGGTVKELVENKSESPAKDESPDASSYKYTWDDCTRPFTQLVRVPSYISGTAFVYLDLPHELLSTRESLTLNLDIESNNIWKIDGLERKSFEGWTPYCSVNGAVLFWRHMIRVNHLPARQTTSISLSTKDLKPGWNTLEFSMGTTTPATWRCIGGETCIAYGIHKMWFSEFPSPSQESTVEKVKDTPGDTEIERKLFGLKQLLDQGLINQEDYNRKKAELLDQL
jgi:hypothetical protein